MSKNVAQIPVQTCMLTHIYTCSCTHLFLACTAKQAVSQPSHVSQNSQHSLTAAFQGGWRKKTKLKFFFPFGNANGLWSWTRSGTGSSPRAVSERASAASFLAVPQKILTRAKSCAGLKRASDQVSAVTGWSVRVCEVSGYLAGCPVSNPVVQHMVPKSEFNHGSLVVKQDKEWKSNILSQRQTTRNVYQLDAKSRCDQ